MIYVYDIEGNRLAVYDAISEEEGNLIHGEDIYISEVNYGEKAIVENNKLRAVTRLDRIKIGEEELRDGEYIENDEIISINKPTNFHIWSREANKWEHDKEKELIQLNSELEGIDKERFLREQTLKEAEAQNRKFVIGGLKKEIAELTKDYDKKYARYQELSESEEK